MIDQKDMIKEKLRAGNCTVVFKKKDGTERTMLCTLNEDAIPLDSRPKHNETSNRSEDAVAVLDLEINAWRSFRYDSIIQFV